jgi:hypothetical protein
MSKHITYVVVSSHYRPEGGHTMIAIYRGNRPPNYYRTSNAMTKDARLRRYDRAMKLQKALIRRLAANSA